MSPQERLDEAIKVLKKIKEAGFAFKSWYRPETFIGKEPVSKKLLGSLKRVRLLRSYDSAFKGVLGEKFVLTEAGSALLGGLSVEASSDYQREWSKTLQDFRELVEQQTKLNNQFRSLFKSGRRITYQKGGKTFTGTILGTEYYPVAYLRKFDIYLLLDDGNTAKINAADNQSITFLDQI